MRAEEFVFGDALLLSGVDRIEFEQVVPSRTSVMPFFWVWGSDFEAFEREAESESTVSAVTPVDSFEDGRLYRAEWSGSVSGLIRGIKSCDAMLLSGVGEDDRWTFEVRFPSDDALTAFGTRCVEEELTLSLEQVHVLSPPDNDLGYRLTPRQRELLVAAAKNGYYEEPRAVSLQGLAEEVGISAPSAGGLLRRGTSQLIESTILSEE